mgnify:CR=1 FL=1
MNKLLYTVFFAVLLTGAIGQSISVTGFVTDTQEETLFSASVVAMTVKDSILTAFALTGDEGRFKLDRLKAEKYIIQVSYLGFEQYYETIDLTDRSGTWDMGQIRMKVSEQVLSTITITGETTPIAVKKDTLEYNALAFQVRPNDVVEDLLRQMQGIEIQEDGTIIAQGEQVRRVLVDGKEFFGTDTKLATKNLPAQAIKKVQFFERQSDMSEFTGVDDGQREKTMNLELKDGHKSGYFGNAGIQGGTIDRYKGSINLNRFGPKTQISMIGNFNNINEQGFSVDQFMSFMNNQGGFGGGRGMGGGINIARDMSDGFVTTNLGGLNLNHEFSKNTKLNFSYYLNDITNIYDRTRARENFLDGNTSFFTNDLSDQTSGNTGHTFRVRFDHKIDSTQDVRLDANLSTARSRLNNNTFNNVISNDIEQNNSLNEYNSNGLYDNFSGSMLYRKLLSSKKSRSITFNGSINTIYNDLTADLEAENIFFPDDPIRELAEQIVQNQFENNDELSYSVQMSFVEPLSPNNYLEAIYRRQNFNNEVLKDIYDVINGVDVLNEVLSNHYDRSFTFDRIGGAFHRNTEKYSLTLEGLLQYSSLKGNLFRENATIFTDNTAFLPRLSYRLNLGNAHNMRVNYTTNIREPSLQQLQPVVDNSNPLSIYIGNPNLVPEYRHNLRINYVKFDQFSFSSFFAFINATYSRNNIINQTFIDEQFRTVSTPINVPYNFNINGNVNYSTPIRALGMKVQVNGNIGYQRRILFINLTENESDIYNTRVGLTLENRKKKYIDVSASANMNYNINTYSINSERNQNFLNQTYIGNLVLRPNDKWNLQSNIRVRVFPEQDFSEGLTVPIWRAGISRFIMKGNRGEISLSVFDILNQNLGLSQSANLNYIETEQIISLGRYFMLGFTYSIRATGGSSPQESGGGRGSRGMHMM